MKHRTVDYDLQEVEPGLWRWNIFPGKKERLNSAVANGRSRLA
ncbi:hypothetical protein [Bradyrhizobium sp. McL0615]